MVSTRRRETVSRTLILQIAGWAKWTCRIRKCITVQNSCTLRHTLVSSITLTYPSPNVNLHCCHFVMMSPPTPPTPFLQGGYWLKSPTGHPWHPRLPLPFFPRWGNCQRGRRRPYQTPALHPNPLSAPPPPFSFVCRGKFTPSLAHPAGSMSPTHCTCTHSAHSNGNNQPPHSLLSISTMNWKISGWFLFFHIESLDQNTKIYLKHWSKSNNHVLSDAIL